QALSLGQSGQLTRRNTAQAAGGLLLSGALSLSRFTLRGLLQGVLSLGFALDSRSPGFLGGLTLCRCPVIISPHGHRLARQSVPLAGGQPSDKPRQLSACRLMGAALGLVPRPVAAG